MVKRLSQKVSKRSKKEELKEVGKAKKETKASKKKEKEIEKRIKEQEQLATNHNGILKLAGKKAREIYNKLGSFQIKSRSKEDHLEYRPTTFTKGEYYKGQWIIGSQIIEGKGIIVFNKNIYEGLFHKGVPVGKGREIYNKSGEVYEGYFKNSKRHGDGVLYKPDKNFKIEGNWDNGNENGY